MCDSRIPEGIVRNANVCFVLVCLLLMGGCGAPRNSSHHVAGDSSRCVFCFAWEERATKGDWSL